MPFDPRTKSRNTTTLPAALRDELGLAGPPARKRHDRAQRFNPHTGSSRPQLKAIGRPQSALNGAQKGASRGPIKSLRNQEKEQKEQLRQQRSHPASAPPQHKQRRVEASNTASSHASSSRRSETNDVRTQQQKRKLEKQPEEALKLIKKSKGTSFKAPEQTEPIEPKTRLNPFTGELELFKPSRKKSSSEKPTALEKMLARAEAGPSSSSRSRSTDTLAFGKKKSRRNMSQQEKDEEDEIRWLEYSLGNSRKGQDVVRDDLDDFLDDLDKFQVGMYDESDSDDEDEEESDDSGLEEVTASEDDEEDSQESGESQSGSGAESASDDVEGDSDLEGVDGMYEFDSNDEDDFSNWDAAMATTDEEEQEDNEDDENDDDEEELSEADDDSEAEEARALIDGAASASAISAAAVPTAAQSTATTTTTSKYIPPALRAKLAAESSSAPTPTPASAPASTDLEMDPIASQKLRRQAQGLLNRLGDANIETILADYEALYRTHPRAHVTSTITQLVLDTITSRSNLVDTFVILHAALVAALHKVVGVEFAAFFVQRLVEELTKHYTALNDGAVGGGGEEEGEEKGKECLNLTVLACELYNLHVVACPLIYDLIRMFLGQQPTTATTIDKTGVTEVDIELLLKTIRSCGFQLRSDDPTSLKSIIALTQSRVASSSSTATSTRTKFMLERMTDLDKKSTSGGKAGGNDASNANSAAGQLLTRMKKFLGGLGRKRTVKAHEALRIGLKDLQDADKKGKWWLVGAAWTGQSDQTDAQGLTKLLPMNATASSLQSSSSAQTPPEDPHHTELLSLARAQGMNTDTRRLVFITLLTSADFRQAAENLLLLKLNDTQRREIIRVLIHCLGSESTYNPYYTLIGQEICRNHHGMRITLQYCLWDFLREIGQKQVGGEKFSAALFESEDQGGSREVDPRRIGNMARAYAWWIARECLSLQSLKTIDFTALHPTPAQFLGLLLIHLVLSVQSKSAAKTLHLPTVTAPLKHEKLTKLVQANLIGGSPDLSKGLLLFLNTKLDERSQRKLVLGEEKGLREKMRPLLEVVKEGVEVVRRTVQVIVQQQDGVADGGEDGVGMDSEDDEEEESDDY
ncbi:Suppressor of glycerol defect protein 1 [Pseudozyma hubeiensis]|nr:Suppressor of glycerol defect protein 1 [Pseudozyma hubeiensis]